jgi:hypothetical protein
VIKSLFNNGKIAVTTFRRSAGNPNGFLRFLRFFVHNAHTFLTSPTEEEPAIKEGRT